ncbi:hypothetical protein EDB19DRAFT_1851854 [Suillus lakei]|nr:hypothetical protein EDB19DRAFT_1851854 [Suillus lakei]
MAEIDLHLQDDDHASSIRYIFLHVKESNHLPPTLWDLHESNVSLKKVSYSFRFVYEAKSTPPVYCIIPLNERYLRSWTLVVPHATTVLQVLPRPKTVFENFSRPSSFQPNEYAYKHYELQREDFLKHSHARAALLRGGILWRLCKASFEGRLGLVNGPSSDVRVFGEAKRFSSPTGDEGATWAGWDDTLTDDEVDLICGVYYVAVEVGAQQQWTTLSWWPRPNIFDKCGLWTGYWNTSREFWFRRRLDLIRCGKAKPYRATQWKGALKYSQSKTRQLCDLTEDVSARFIGKVLG